MPVLCRIRPLRPCAAPVSVSRYVGLPFSLFLITAIMKISYAAASVAVFCLALSSCGGPEFKIDGEVYGAEGKSIVLEKSDFHGRWIPVDSVRIGGTGKFSIKADAPASPEVYRLSLGDRFVYFPVDSIENLTLTTSDAGFGSDFLLSGTPQAERMAAFEKELIALQNPDSAALADFKRKVYSEYIRDGRGSIVSYYLLTKIVDGKPLYDPADAEDAKYYAAVATQFENYRPDDPHGRMVKEVSLQAMRARNSAQGKKTVIRANELRVLDINLPDEKGKNVRLSDVVGKGKPVVVVFSMMNTPESPDFNRQLARIYESKGGTVEFYQVSFDTGQYEWREAASNLPWITVLDPSGTASNTVIDYNLGTLPAVFIYDAAGDLVDRPESLDDLARKI